VNCLSTRNLAYLHILEPTLENGSFLATDIPPVSASLREAYKGVLIQNGGLTQETFYTNDEKGFTDYPTMALEPAE